MATRSSTITREGDWLRLPCLCANIRRLARLATRIYDEEMRPAGMEVGQFGLTAAVARVGPVTQSELARGLAMDQTSLTRTLALLQKRGWIEKRVGADRRSRVFAVTPAGLHQLEVARPFWRRAQQRMLDTLGDDHADRLTSSVEHAATALADPGACA